MHVILCQFHFVQQSSADGNHDETRKRGVKTEAKTYPRAKTGPKKDSAPVAVHEVKVSVLSAPLTGGQSLCIQALCTAELLETKCRVSRLAQLLCAHHRLG